MKAIKWFECVIPVEEIVKGVLLSFQVEMEKALDLAGWPEDAAVFASAWDEDDNARIWITDTAAQAADKVGFLWKQYLSKQLDGPPPKSKSALLLGHQSAWDLLKQE